MLVCCPPHSIAAVVVLAAAVVVLARYKVGNIWARLRWHLGVLSHNMSLTVEDEAACKSNALLWMLG